MNLQKLNTAPNRHISGPKLSELKINSTPITIQKLLVEHKARVELQSLESFITSDPEIVKVIEAKKSDLLDNVINAKFLQHSNDDLLETAFEMSEKIHGQISPEILQYPHLGQFGLATYIIGSNDITNPFPKQIKNIIYSSSPLLNYDNSSVITLISSEISKLSGAVCCIVEDPHWYESHDNQEYLLNTEKFGHRYDLASEEDAFYHEPCLAKGSASGFLIAPNLLVTAEHVIRNKTEEELKSLRFIFGYTLEEPEKAEQVIIPENQVYKFNGITQSGSRSDANPTSYSDDWCIIELDRNVENVTPCSLSHIEPTLERPIAMLGHPRGLCQKAVMKGEITSSDDSIYTCNLDSFSGNSGSPIIDLNTLQVIGIFTRGRPDFEWDEDFTFRSNAQIGDDQSFYEQKFISIRPILPSLEQHLTPNI